MKGAYYDRIRHTLYSQHSSPLVIIDPIGYEESEQEFTRTLDNVGIIANFSADLKFVGDGLEFIKNIVKNHGLNELLTLKREEKHPQTDEWVLMYSGTLDLSTFKIENGECAVKINAGGFDKIFKSRETEKLEIETETSIDGDELPPLQLKNLTLEGRRIFLKTQFDVLETENEAEMYRESNAENVERGGMVTVPINKFSSSHDEAHSQNPNTFLENNNIGQSGESDGTAGMMFFTSLTQQRTLKIQLVISYKMHVVYDDLDWANFWLRIAKYENGTDFNFKEAENIHFSTNPLQYHNQTITSVHNTTITVEAGESLSLQFGMLMRTNGNAFRDHALTINCSDIIAGLTIEEDSTFEPTNTKTILLHDLGERLSQIITGEQGRFRSNVLGRTDLGYSQNGKWGYVGTYCGHWLRNFNLGDDLYKKYTTTFKDYVNTLKSMFNLHVGFMVENGVEKVVIEPMTYFFNPNIVLRLPNPLKNVKEYVAEDLIFSGITMGYEKGAEVEGIIGLDEPNGQSNWATNMTVIKNSHEKTAKYIAGVYMEEKQRRFQKSLAPTEDKENDKDIFIKDLKLVSGQLRERKWQDDFISAPTGIFSPETAKNLRFSPAHNLRRHGNFISTAFKQYLDKYLKFGSSSGNSTMTTFSVEESFSENQDVLNGDLANRLFEPFYIEGEHIVDFDVLTTLQGNSIFDGVQTPNFYCKVEFRLEDEPDQLRYGYIMSMKPNGAGSWKFIEASNLTI